MNASTETSKAPRVVIVGAGFGGLAAAKALAKAPVQTTIIDRQNYHLFQPLLYQVATAALSPADIAWPIRTILGSQQNTRVVMGEVQGVDPAHKRIVMHDREIAYDYLVLATGATHAYFGHDGWAPYAPGLKRLDDATDIRRRILLAFERAEVEADPEHRRAMLTFVVVGAGPTGVEMAGSMAELARKALAADFRNVDPRQARIVLVDAGSRVLPTFPNSLSRYAETALRKLGVEVKLGAPVTRCSELGVTLDGHDIPTRTVIWAAGVVASPAARWLNVEADRAGRVPVDAQLRASGYDDVHVIGDTALCLDKHNKPLPGIAPVAKQQGAHAGKLISALVLGMPEPAPFRYRDWGKLATIGRRAAVIDWDIFRIKGWLAWWIWGMVHIYFLINLRSRMMVALQWLWSYLTFERGARLIIGVEDQQIETR